MNRKQILEDITEIFHNLFDDNTLLLTEETTAQDIEDWDSLEQINILVALENKFQIKFKLEDISSLENVGDMVSLVEKTILLIG